MTHRKQRGHSELSLLYLSMMAAGLVMMTFSLGVAAAVFVWIEFYTTSGILLTGVGVTCAILGLILTVAGLCFHLS